MSRESWHASKLSEMDVIRIVDSDDFVVDYDKSRGMYRVSVFKDNHFADEIWFDSYEEKEMDDRIEKIIGYLENVKQNLKNFLDGGIIMNGYREKRMLDANLTKHLFDKLIEHIKELK